MVTAPGRAESSLDSNSGTSRLMSLSPVTFRLQHHNCDPQPRNILLERQISIDRDKCVRTARMRERAAHHS